MDKFFVFFCFCFLGELEVVKNIFGTRSWDGSTALLIK